RLKAADTDAVRHLQPFQHRATGGINTANLAFVFFPRTMPQLAINPGHACYEAIGLDTANDFSAARINLMDLAILILADPQTPFSPGKPGVITMTGCRNRCQ